RSMSRRSWASCWYVSAYGKGLNPSPIRPRGSRAALAPPTQRLAAATWTPASTTAPARSTCRYSSRVRAWTATAREVVPGSAVLSMIRTRTPSLVSQRASTRPVGPAPMIRTSRSLIDPLQLSTSSHAPTPLRLRGGLRPQLQHVVRPDRRSFHDEVPSDLLPAANSGASALCGTCRDMHRAGRPFHEAFCLDPEAAVEASPEILPHDRRGQLHHLLWVE